MKFELLYAVRKAELSNEHKEIEAQSAETVFIRKRYADDRARPELERLLLGHKRRVKNWQRLYTRLWRKFVSLPDLRCLFSELGLFLKGVKEHQRKLNADAEL